MAHCRIGIAWYRDRAGDSHSGGYRKTSFTEEATETKPNQTWNSLQRHQPHFSQIHSLTEAPGILSLEGTRANKFSSL